MVLSLIKLTESKLEYVLTLILIFCTDSWRLSGASVFLIKLAFLLVSKWSPKACTIPWRSHQMVMLQVHYKWGGTRTLLPMESNRRFLNSKRHEIIDGEKMTIHRRSAFAKFTFWPIWHWCFLPCSFGFVIWTYIPLKGQSTAFSVSFLGYSIRFHRDLLLNCTLMCL